MPDRTYLGLDLGTSSLKAALVDPTGAVVEQATVAYPLEHPAPGHAEIDPAAWWSAAVAAVTSLAGRSSVAAIGLSGQMHGVVLIDPTGAPTRPAVLWPDTRAAAQLDAYAALPGPVRSRLANPLAAGMAGPVLRWLRDHEPAALAAARWAVQPKDWLRTRLTRDIVGDPSDASATLLYDVIADAWDLEACALLGIDGSLLPPLAPSGATAGQLVAPVAAELGLPPGIPVATGAADTAAAALGSALHLPATVQLSVGTGGQWVAPLDAPAPAPDAGTHLYRAATARGWYAMAATLNAGLALEWVRGVTGADWDEVYGSTDVRAGDPVFLPHLAGERTPYLDARMRGAWSGLSLDHDRATVLRSALEGVAHAIRDAFEVLPVAATVDVVRVAGGGSHHPGWRQLLADVLGRPLVAVDAPAASARGAALLGAIAAGELTESDVTGTLAPRLLPVADPRPATAALHRDRWRAFQALVDAGRGTVPTDDDTADQRPAVS